MIQQMFNALPPRAYLEQLMHEPCNTYVFLWDRKNNNNKVLISWSEVLRHYNKNCFRTNLRRLNNKGLIDYKETDENVEIELVGWEEE